MAVTLVQSKMQVEGINVGSTTVTPTSATITGNTLIVIIGLYSSDGGSNEIDMAASNPVIDAAGNTYTPITAAEVKRTATTYYQHTYYYIATKITGFSGAITCTFARTTHNYVSVYELTPSQLDQATTATGTGTNAVNAGTLTPPTNGAFALLQSEFEGSGSAFTAGSGWTGDRNASAGGGVTWDAHLAQTTAAAINFTATGPTSGAQQWLASGITLIPRTIFTPGQAHSRAQGTIQLGLAGIRQIGALTVTAAWHPRPAALIHARALGAPTVHRP